jgi:hypothetical protein
MLDLWRPPHGAGDPVGCLATTYTFAPGLFDEQCLARFLEIESEPNREDLAFLLERESRLGSVYAGVLVDYTQAGVEHSLRWDVLPVRIRAGKQHAKLSLLAWTRHIRIIVASANITDAGYRTNYEVAGTVECDPEDPKGERVAEAIGFLRSLLRAVPAAAERPPEVGRAYGFLEQVERQARKWNEKRRRGSVRQQLVFTLPSLGPGSLARSGLDEAMGACRARGGSPHEAWIASPFFDVDEETSRVTAALCKAMARGRGRYLCFCVPVSGDGKGGGAPRLAAPRSLVTTPLSYQGGVSVEVLPDVDEDKNRRPWHAKMLGLLADGYSALVVGSSNFTCAGMGVTERRNAEANLLTIVDRVAYGREANELEAVWPKMEQIANPEAAEWLGAKTDREEEEVAAGVPLPAGFLGATYRAGDERRIAVRLDPSGLPAGSWRIASCGRHEMELLCSVNWAAQGNPGVIEVAWAPVQPPEKLLVQWGEHEGFLPLNVEDGRRLPPPVQLEKMSADDMLLILAASDPSGAFRVWAKRQQANADSDGDLDSAVPVDLDPLRRYDLQATYLHRIRRRARVLAQLRANLQRPVWGKQALEWRLRGLVGIQSLAERLFREFASADGPAGEALLTLADFLIVLHEVDYQASEGALSKAEFEAVFRGFLKELAMKLNDGTRAHRDRVPADLLEFWDRVVERCAV